MVLPLPQGERVDWSAFSVTKLLSQCISLGACRIARLACFFAILADVAHQFWPTFGELTVDHFDPVSAGGDDNNDNLNMPAIGAMNSKVR